MVELEEGPHDHECQKVCVVWSDPGKKIMAKVIGGCHGKEP